MVEDPRCECGKSDPAMAHCALCHENTVSLQDMIHHIRQFHPDHYEEPERWPDGGIVVRDGHPAIEDFLTPQQVQVPAQDATWTCPTCLASYAFTVLWYTLEPVSVQCPDCKGDPVWIQPPQL